MMLLTLLHQIGLALFFSQINKPIRQMEINNPSILRRVLVCLRSCCVRRLASYVTEGKRPKTDKKASKVGGLFVSSCLNHPDKKTPPNYIPQSHSK